MKIWRKSCGHSEKTNKELFVKILGAAMPVGGFWAWVSFFFAGTGLAMPICIAIVTGGVGILVYKNKIVKWISNRYACPKCNSKGWEVIQDDI